MNSLERLADRVEAAMIRAAKNGLNNNPGVTGQAKCMEFASHCATVLSALRATAHTHKDIEG